MRVNRKGLLTVLESLSPGLAKREIIEQSSCFAFSNSRVFTFNDEIACQMDSPLDIEGAIRAKQLLELLGKLEEEDLDITIDAGQMIVKGMRRKAGIRMEAEVSLPVESVEVPKDTDWRALPTDFGEAIRIVHTCASTEESKYLLTCVHLHPNYIEASDTCQIARYPIETQLTKSTLVRAESLKRIIGLDVTQIAETPAWLHFKNPSDLVVSCRRSMEDFFPLDEYLTGEGTESVTLPNGLEEVLNKASIFSEENAAGNVVTVDISTDRIIIHGEGASGYYREMKKIAYRGRSVRFMASPKLILEITKKCNDCKVSEDKLFVDTGKFIYVAATYEPVASPQTAEVE